MWGNDEYGTCRRCSDKAFIIVEDNSNEGSVSIPICEYHYNIMLIELEMKGFYKSTLDGIGFR